MTTPPYVSGGETTMSNGDEIEARLEVNDKHQNVVALILCLSTGCLVLSIVFLRDIVGFTGSCPLGGWMNGIISSWISLLLSVTSCLIYFYASAKFMKSIHNLELSQFWRNNAEAFCCWFLRLSIVFFWFGVLFFILYAYLIYFRLY